MGAFVSKEPVRIELPERPGEYIAIKAKLSAGDRSRLLDMSVKVKAEKDADVTVDAGQYTLLGLMQVAFLGWRLLDDDGAEVPFDRKLIEDLDRDDPLVDAALAEIARRNPTGESRSGASG